MNAWLFWIAAGAMAAGVVALLLRRLLTLDTGPASPDGFDSTVYRDQLEELERERAAGEIGAAEAEAARAEIARRLLAASAATKPAVAAPSRPPQMVAMGLAMLLPMAVLAIYLLVLISLWSGVGFCVVVYLAALQDVPPELVEAARIDGAGRGRVLRHIVLPTMLYEQVIEIE